MKRVDDAVWRARLEAVRERVAAGEALTNACAAELGYIGNHYLASRYPGEWAQIKEAAAESAAARRARDKATRRDAKERRRARVAHYLATDYSPTQAEARARAMLCLRACGWTLDAIGKLFEITRERVRQVISEYAGRDDIGGAA